MHYKKETGMFGVNWQTSERQYGIIDEREVRIRMSDGVDIDTDVVSPGGPGLLRGHRVGSVSALCNGNVGTMGGQCGSHRPHKPVACGANSRRITS
jgi:hypothetical protein